MLSTLLAPLGRLKAVLGYRAYRFRRNFGYDLWQTPDAPTCFTSFGLTPPPGNLIADYLLSPNIQIMGRVRCWPTADIADRLARHHGLVVFKDTYIPRDLRHRLLHLPDWVGMTREITGDIAAIRAGLQTRLRRTLQAIEKNFRVETTRDSALLEEFHDRHYRPAMLDRHGPAARLIPLAAFQSSMRTGSTELLRVFEGDAWIASLYASYSSEGYRLEQFGWRDGDIAILQKGVIKLLYWNAIVRAAELGVKCLHFGGTPACLLSGILFQKTQWGARLARTGNRYGTSALLLDPAHPDARRFLSRHALVFPSEAGGFFVLSGLEPAEIPSNGSQSGCITAWYRLRATPAATPGPDSALADLPTHLRPWFDSVPLSS